MQGRSQSFHSALGDCCCAHLHHCLDHGKDNHVQNEENRLTSTEDQQALEMTEQITPLLSKRGTHELSDGQLIFRLLCRESNTDKP